jgi:hypothetical protein
MTVKSFWENHSVLEIRYMAHSLDIVPATFFFQQKKVLGHSRPQE